MLQRLFPFFRRDKPPQESEKDMANNPSFDAQFLELFEQLVQTQVNLFALGQNANAIAKSSAEHLAEIARCLSALESRFETLSRQLEPFLAQQSAQNLYEYRDPAPAIPPAASLASPRKHRTQEEKWRDAIDDLARAASEEVINQQEELYGVLVTNWVQNYIETPPEKWDNQAFFRLDKALYSAPEALAEEVKAFQKRRIGELSDRGILRIDGVKGLTDPIAGEIECDYDESLRDPHTPAEGGKFHSIKPGKGGYRYGNRILRKTAAVLYGYWLPSAPLPTESQESL